MSLISGLLERNASPAAFSRLFEATPYDYIFVGLYLHIEKKKLFDALLIFSDDQTTVREHLVRLFRNETIIKNEEWHPNYFTVSELADMRKNVKLPHSPSTMTREIDKEVEAKRIQRDGNKPMRIRMDLYDEWSPTTR